MKVDSRSTTTTSGALCVTITGPSVRLLSSATLWGSLDQTPMPSYSPGVWSHLFVALMNHSRVLILHMYVYTCMYTLQKL